MHFKGFLGWEGKAASIWSSGRSDTFQEGKTGIKTRFGGGGSTPWFCSCRLNWLWAQAGRAPVHKLGEPPWTPLQAKFMTQPEVLVKHVFRFILKEGMGVGREKGALKVFFLFRKNK